MPCQIAWSPTTFPLFPLFHSLVNRIEVRTSKNITIASKQCIQACLSSRYKCKRVKQRAFLGIANKCFMFTCCLWLIVGSLAHKHTKLLFQKHDRIQENQHKLNKFTTVFRCGWKYNLIGAIDGYFCGNCHWSFGWFCVRFISMMRHYLPLFSHNNTNVPVQHKFCVQTKLFCFRIFTIFP